MCSKLEEGRNEKDSLTDRDAKPRKVADTTSAVCKHYLGTGYTKGNRTGGEVGVKQEVFLNM